MFRETPAMRAVAQRLLPSTSAETIWTRLDVLSAFAIVNILLERVGIVGPAVVTYTQHSEIWNENGHTWPLQGRGLDDHFSIPQGVD